MNDDPIILVVDDDAPILALMRTLLKEFGFHAVTAADGRQALTEARKKRPALVLLDKHLAGMGVEEIIRGLRSAPGLEHLPILMLSGARLSATELHALGADGAVLKPFDVAALIEEIRRHLPAAPQL